MICQKIDIQNQQIFSYFQEPINFIIISLAIPTILYSKKEENIGRCRKVRCMIF